MHADSHIGRTRAGRTHTGALVGPGRRTHASPQDARKGRPYYGRGLVSLARVLRKTDVSMHKGDGTRALVGTSRRTHASPQDARKGRPYYGRGLGAGYHFPRTPMPDRLDGWGLGRGRVLARLDSPKPGHTPRRFHATHAQPTHTRHRLRRFHATHALTRPTPVHSRDAPCVRPVGSRASCRLACVLSARVRPAGSRASCGLEGGREVGEWCRRTREKKESERQEG